MPSPYSHISDTLYLSHFSTVVHYLFFLVIIFLICSGILVLLVFGDQIIHVALGLGEFHLVHALTSVPVKESFSPEHGILGLFTHDVKNGVDELGALGVVPLGPVVSGARLPENEVVRPEDLAVGPCADAVHGPGLEIHEHRPGDEPPATRFVVVDIYAFKLQIGRPNVLPGRTDAVLFADDLPELGSDLVTALPPLNVKYFSHFSFRSSAFFDYK
ncbi:hypothetical protein EJ110_NYTH41162 [Nymphaea thermarum]|nr:hypothetical protein EJ110_NYTH41162 [Nymphaea thermarum]